MIGTFLIRELKLKVKADVRLTTCLRLTIKTKNRAIRTLSNIYMELSGENSFGFAKKVSS